VYCKIKLLEIVVLGVEWDHCRRNHKSMCVPGNVFYNLLTKQKWSLFLPNTRPVCRKKQNMLTLVCSFLKVVPVGYRFSSKCCARNHWVCHAWCAGDAIMRDRGHCICSTWPCCVCRASTVSVYRHDVALILPKRRKTLINQSINQSTVSVSCLSCQRSNNGY
jgi:hypothetical protein